MARVVLSGDLVTKAMQSRVTRDALAKRRDAIARRAEALAGGDDINIRTEDGTRPKGRPYSRVLADAEQEFGSSRTERRRILGRAAGTE